MKNLKETIKEFGKTYINGGNGIAFDYYMTLNVEDAGLLDIIYDIVDELTLNDEWEEIKINNDDIEISTERQAKKVTSKQQQQEEEEAGKMENLKNEITKLYEVVTMVENANMGELISFDFNEELEKITGYTYDINEVATLNEIYDIESEVIEEATKHQLEEYGVIRMSYFMGDVNGNTDYVEFDGYGNLREVFFSDVQNDIVDFINKIIGEKEDALWEMEYKTK